MCVLMCLCVSDQGVVQAYSEASKPKAAETMLPRMGRVGGMQAILTVVNRRSHILFPRV